MEGLCPDKLCGALQVILRDGEPDPSGVRCVPDLRSVGEPLDLFIVAVGAEHVPVHRKRRMKPTK